MRVDKFVAVAILPMIVQAGDHNPHRALRRHVIYHVCAVHCVERMCERAECMWGEAASPPHRPALDTGDIVCVSRRGVVLVACT